MKFRVRIYDIRQDEIWYDQVKYVIDFNELFDELSTHKYFTKLEKSTRKMSKLYNVSEDGDLIDEVWVEKIDQNLGGFLYKFTIYSLKNLKKSKES